MQWPLLLAALLSDAISWLRSNRGILSFLLSCTILQDIARYFFQQLVCGVAWCHRQVRQRSAGRPACVFRCFERPDCEML